VAGDSHIYWGFLTAQGILNLGIGGSSIDTLSPMLKSYYRTHEPGQLVLEAAPQMFNAFRKRQRLPEGSYELRHLPAFMYFFEPAVVTSLRRVFSGPSITESIRSLRQQRIKNEANSETTDIWSDFPAETRLQKTKKRVNSHRPIWDARANQTIETYEELLRFLKTRNVEVCFLRTPVSSEYLQLTAGDTSFSRSEDVFKDLARQFELRYVDFRSLNINWTETMFLNQDHIRPHYSQEFADRTWDACFN